MSTLLTTDWPKCSTTSEASSQIFSTQLCIMKNMIHLVTLQLMHKDTHFIIWNMEHNVLLTRQQIHFEFKLSAHFMSVIYMCLNSLSSLAVTTFREDKMHFVCGWCSGPFAKSWSSVTAPASKLWRLSSVRCQVFKCERLIEWIWQLSFYIVLMGLLWNNMCSSLFQDSSRGLAAVKKETILLWRETGIIVLFEEEGSRACGLREREGEMDWVNKGGNSATLKPVVMPFYKMSNYMLLQQHLFLWCQGFWHMFEQ